MAEKYIRTLKSLLYKFFDERRTFRYILLLQKIVELVNNKNNRHIGMAASRVTQRHVPKLLALQTAKLETKTNQAAKRFKIGDRVRIAIKVMPFAKGYKQQNTSEVFKIVKVHQYKKGSVTYKLLDSDNEPILGQFYQPELVYFLSNIFFTRFVLSFPFFPSSLPQNSCMWNSRSRFEFLEQLLK